MKTKTHKKYGTYTIEDTDSKYKKIITFQNTGYRYVEGFGNVKRGIVKDPYHPTIQGKGCIGEGEYELEGKCADLWQNLLRKHSDKMPSEWFCFQVFVDSIKSLPNYDKWEQGTIRFDPKTMAFKVGAVQVGTRYGDGCEVIAKVTSHKWLVRDKDGNEREEYSYVIRALSIVQK